MSRSDDDNDHTNPQHKTVLHYLTNFYQEQFPSDEDGDSILVNIPLCQSIVIMNKCCVTGAISYFSCDSGNTVVTDLAIVDNLRHQGYGSFLMIMLMKALLGQGFGNPHLYLQCQHVNADEKTPFDFYTSLGFRPDSLEAMPGDVVDLLTNQHPSLRLVDPPDVPQLTWMGMGLPNMKIPRTRGMGRRKDNAAINLCKSPQKPLSKVGRAGQEQNGPPEIIDLLGVFEPATKEVIVHSMFSQFPVDGLSHQQADYCSQNLCLLKPPCDLKSAPNAPLPHRKSKLPRGFISNNDRKRMLRITWMSSNLMDMLLSFSDYCQTEKDFQVIPPFETQRVSNIHSAIEKNKTGVSDSDNPFGDFMTNISQLQEFFVAHPRSLQKKFLFYPCNIMEQHWVAFLAINPMSVQNPDAATNSTTRPGFLYYDPMGVKGDLSDAPPYDQGFLLFLELHRKFDLMGEEETLDHLQTWDSFHNWFSGTPEIYPTKAFPQYQLSTPDHNLLKQDDCFDCGYFTIMFLIEMMNENKMHPEGLTLLDAVNASDSVKHVLHDYTLGSNLHTIAKENNLANNVPLNTHFRRQVICLVDRLAWTLCHQVPNYANVSHVQSRLTAINLLRVNPSGSNRVPFAANSFMPLNEQWVPPVWLDKIDNQNAIKSADLPDKEPKQDLDNPANPIKKKLPPTKPVKRNDLIPLDKQMSDNEDDDKDDDKTDEENQITSKTNTGQAANEKATKKNSVDLSDKDVEDTDDGPTADDIDSDDKRAADDVVELNMPKDPPSKDDNKKEPESKEDDKPDKEKEISSKTENGKAKNKKATKKKHAFAPTSILLQKELDSLYGSDVGWVPESLTVNMEL